MITKLFDSFQPNSYTLALNIDTEESRFSGQVKISGKLITATSVVTLHAKELIILSAYINGTEVKFKVGSDDTLQLIHDTEVSKGSVDLEITFSGTITDSMHGVYPCYFEHNGVRKKLIATQFESHHAREVFPCIDEPAAKATFNLSLETPSNQTVLANTPVQTKQSKSGRTITRFETTPLMSTYLLAFVCGEMVYKEAKTKDGVTVRCWASAAQDTTWLDYSVNETVNLIEFYNEYFGVPYPLAKCDQVALPDFESGAMENWGLITYRETVLLSDPKNISLSTQQLITLVVAHELSHQWFGNLVTMQWWDDLWLNESFANMTEYLAADRLHPEWHIWEEFVAQDVISATNRDVYKDVQAVRVEVNDPAEIHTLFDPSIVYAKGGKLLKMLHDILGDEAWRTGLKKYFKKHAYKNTSRDDLWESLSSVSEVNVPKLMNTWIEQPGQPLVTVSQDNSSLKLSQERFLLDGSGSTVWQVPLISKGAPFILTEKQSELKLESSEMILLNESGVGHYITNYTTPDHKAWVASKISDPAIPSEWKISYLNGLVMLSRHGDTHLDEALEAIKNAESEPRAAVWSQISNIIGSSRLIIEGNEQLENSIKKLSYNLSLKHREALGWEYKVNEPSNDVHLRTTALAFSIASEDESVISTALNLYSSVDDPEELSAEIRSMLMGVAVRFGNKNEFEKLIEAYKSSSNADYKADICAALCSTKNTDQAMHLTELMLDTSVVRTQDTIRWYIYLLRNHYVRDVAWSWLTKNWEWVMEQFGGSKSYDDFARYSATLFSTAQHLTQYKQFFEPMKSDPALKRAITIGINEISAKSKWRTRDYNSVASWLSKYQLENS